MVKKTDVEKEYNCYFELTLDVIGGKWKPIILYYTGIREVIRYSELKRLIPNINERMLTKQLRELEADMVISRKVYPVVPPKVEYSVTEHGKRLIPVLENLKGWGKDYAKDTGTDTFKMQAADGACTIK